MKHNKKRNTAFIYEILSRELTRAILDKNVKNKNKIVSIIKEHFGKGSLLAEELILYRALLETINIQENIAERMLQETKFAYSKLDGKTIFDAQSQVIAAINKDLSQTVWGRFIPNFKSLASVSAIFNNKTSVKKKVLFEQALVNQMSARHPSKVKTLQSVDNLTYNSFIKKFNDKYGDLLYEQKDLLNRYITSFADDGFELRVYLNEELYRLKGVIADTRPTITEPLILQKLVEIVEYLEGFKRREFVTQDLSKILKTQQLAQELVKND